MRDFQPTVHLGNGARYGHRYYEILTENRMGYILSNCVISSDHQWPL